MRYPLAAMVLAVSAGFVVQAQPSRFDVVIRNGRVLDGSGNPWMRLDIGVREGRIAAMGRLGDAAATTSIDAAGRYVAPGFIDVHSHAAEGLNRAELRQARPIVAQGVTTLVVNPDGGGPIDLAAQRRMFETSGLGPNIALLIGHGSVRNSVMKGDPRREPTAEELDRMRALVRRAMDEGAFGLSSGLFYTPGSFAKTEEVIALAAAAGERGGVYTSHIRDEGDYGSGLVASVQEVIRIADEGHVTGIVSHMKALGPDNWGLSMAATRRIEQARARGVPVFADQYPYEASSTSLRAALLPGGADVSDQATLAENLRRRGGAASIRIASYAPDRGLEGKSLAEIAAAKKIAPEAAATEILKAGNASIVSFNMSDEDITHIMTRPYTMASSDGGLVAAGSGMPHPRNNGAFARRLALYVRERGVVGLEFAIRSMTSLPASVFGFEDRGVIRQGAIADLVVFDLAAIKDNATYAEPHKVAEGMSWVLINGVPIIANGSFTDAMPGKVLRKSQR